MTTEPDKPPRRLLSLLLCAVVALGAVAVAVLFAGQGLDRVRADTPVAAVAQGEPGCVDTATFTGPDGVERSVGVMVYKSSCLDRDPGDPLTVYYDADAPSVTASSRSWRWSLLVAAAALGVLGVALRGAVINVRALRAS